MTRLLITNNPNACSPSVPEPPPAPAPRRGETQTLPRVFNRWRGAQTAAAGGRGVPRAERFHSAAQETGGFLITSAPPALTSRRFSSSETSVNWND